MIHAHQRDVHAARRPRQAGLEVGDRKIGTEGLQLPHHAVDERAELAGLVVEAGGDRLHHVEPTAAVFEDHSGDFLDPDQRVPGGEPLSEEIERVGGGPDQDLVVGFEPVDERADAGSVPPALSAEADRNFRHGGVGFRW